MTPFEQFIHPARAHLGWWRPLVGLVMIFGLWILGAVLAVTGWVIYQLEQGLGVEEAMADLTDLTTGGSTAKVVVMLLTFLGVWGGCWMATEIVHRQRFMTLFSPSGRIFGGAFARGFAMAMVFSLGTTAIALLFIEAPVQALALSDWAIILVPIAVLIFFQATAEELIFRGYLLQQLAVRFRSALIWAALPSFLFGLLHYDNASAVPTSFGTSFSLFGAELVIAKLYYVAVTFLAGLVFAALVWRTGNLWAAAGLHTGVNIFGLCGIGADGLLSGPQLFLYSNAQIGQLLEVDVIASLLMLIFVLSPAGRILESSHRA